MQDKKSIFLLNKHFNMFENEQFLSKHFGEHGKEKLFPNDSSF